jgi:MinD superfamily P-loop ATPase
VAASLASVWDRPLAAVDLDVEEPNLHLFLHPVITRREAVSLEVPVADESRCTLCRACAELCQFKAVSVMGTVLLTFPEMCHGCGGCIAVCPAKCLTPGARELGTMEEGHAGSAAYLMGRLRIGEAMSPPLMRAERKRLAEVLADGPMDAVIDSPPGVSCPAVSAVMDSDFIVLVTEPTPFGLHDLRLAVEAFAPLGKPMGAVVNRAGIGDGSVQAFCRERGLPLLAEIPYARDIAEGYARGRVVAGLSPELRGIFTGLRDDVRSRLAAREAANG